MGAEAVTDEHELLRAARAGDEDAFGGWSSPTGRSCARTATGCSARCTTPRTPSRTRSCVPGAALARFEGRSSFRSWLYTIATNSCLPDRAAPQAHPADRLLAGRRSARHAGRGAERARLARALPGRRGLASELLGPDARYEQRESIELAFIAALQHLPARQRAVLILREVLGFSAREAAEALETSSISVDSALQRAHRAIAERVPGRSQQETVRALGDGALDELVTRFADAWEQHDVDGIVALLADDARMTMPPQPSWYQGRDAVATFLGRFPLAPGRRFRLHPISASAQPALAAYIWRDETGSFEAESILVLTLRDEQVEEITAFRTPHVFARFGIPEQLPI